jgi:hypothetical protein
MGRTRLGNQFLKGHTFLPEFKFNVKFVCKHFYAQLFSGYALPIKRHCGTSTPKSAASPLVRDPLSSQPNVLPTEVTSTTSSDLRASSPYCSTSTNAMVPNFSLGKSPLLDLSFSNQ